MAKATDDSAARAAAEAAARAKAEQNKRDSEAIERARAEWEGGKRP